MSAVEFFSQVFNTSIADLGTYLFDPNKRIYWGYLLGALLLAIPVYFKAASAQQGVSGFLRFVFPKSIYLAPSARMDYLLLILNKLLKAALFAPVVLTMVPVAMGLSDGLEWLFGKLEPLSSNALVVMAAFTLLLFILDDFTRFLLHWLLHKVPVLWAFHKVHHSAEVMTPFTIYRTHPVESYLYACRMALAQGCAVGMGYYLFGPTLKMYDVLGANLFVFIFNVMGSNLRHSHIWLPWGDKIESWFISPAQHQIHHSIAIEHRDTNLGSALAIWDRMWGCLVKSSSVTSLKIGVGGNPGHDTVQGIYLNPFREAFRHLVSLFAGANHNVSQASSLEKKAKVNSVKDVS